MKKRLKIPDDADIRRWINVRTVFVFIMLLLLIVVCYAWWVWMYHRAAA